MKPDRKIPQPIFTLESTTIRHFATGRKMTIPYKEKFYIIVRRFRSCSRVNHTSHVIDIRAFISK